MNRIHRKTKPTFGGFAYIIGTTFLLLGQAPHVLAQNEDPAQVNVDTAQEQASHDAVSEEGANQFTHQIEEIVVTANRRSETISEIAGSVAAVGGGDLEKRNAKDMESFLKLVPGVSLNKGESGSNAPSIRGVASSTGLGISQAATGVYLDEVSTTGPYASYHTIDPYPFDLQRIEVLKGPQAVLYGSNAISGAIRYILEKPQLGEWQAKLSVDYVSMAEGSQAYSTAVAVNIPIYRDEIAIRAVGVLANKPGYIDDNSVDRGIEDANTGELTQGRFLATWKPENLPLQITGTYLQQEATNDEATFADQTEEYERSNSPTPNYTNDKFTMASLLAEYDFSWATLVSSTSYIEKESNLVTDGGRALGSSDQSLTTTQVPVSTTAETIGQEFRLQSPDDSVSPWSWLVGVLYNKYEGFLFLGIHQYPRVDPLLASNGLLIGGISTDVYNQYMPSTGTEYAVFAEVSRDFFERLSVSLGGRYYNTQLESTSYLNGSLTLAATGMPAVTSTATLEERGFSPKASVRYQFTEGISIYTAASRGFRFGGNQFLEPPAYASTNGTVPRAYKSDTLWNYEVGTRTAWLDERLRIDATLFYIEWEDLQIQRAAIQGLYNYVDNVGSANIKGLELAASFADCVSLIKGCYSISNSTAFIDAVTSSAFDAGQSSVASGTRLPGTPRFQTANIVSFSSQIGGFSPQVSATHTYIGPSKNNIFEQIEIGDYHTFDFALFVSYEDASFYPTLSVTLKNALGNKAIANATADPNTSYVDYYFIQPRTLEMAFTVKF